MNDPRYPFWSSHPRPFKDDRKTKRDWNRCCFKCKHNNLKLPTIIGSYEKKTFVKLPDNMLTFSKPFRSVISLTDCQDKSEGEKIHKINFEWNILFDYKKKVGLGLAIQKHWI